MKSRKQLEKHIERMNHCGEDYEFCFNLNETNKILLKICKHRCHSYFCPECSKIKKAKLIEKLEKGLKNQSWRFLTLTTSRYTGSIPEAINSINYAFNKFHKRFKKTSYNFKYFKVLEFQKNGYPHFHILVNKYIPKPLISAFWKHYTGSYIVDIKYVRNNKGLIKYLLKYLTKSDDYENNKKFYMFQKRRFSYSQSFFMKIPEKIHYYATRIIWKKFVDFVPILEEYFFSYYGIHFENNYELIGAIPP